MKLYWHPFSIMPWRIRIALHEKGIRYESIQVDVYASRHRTPDFLEMNPFGQIPVLEHDGVTISESIAILEYLEERYPAPALLPTDVVARAMVRQWMCWSTDYWPPAWKKWMAPRLDGSSGRMRLCWKDDGNRGASRRHRVAPRGAGLARRGLFAGGCVLRAARDRAGSRGIAG